MRQLRTEIFQVRPTLRGGWQILDDAGAALAAFDEREDALLYAIELAKARFEGCVELYSASGQLVSRDHYRGIGGMLDLGRVRRV